MEKYKSGHMFILRLNRNPNPWICVSINLATVIRYQLFHPFNSFPHPHFLFSFFFLFLGALFTYLTDLSWATRKNFIALAKKVSRMISNDFCFLRLHLNLFQKSVKLECHLYSLLNFSSKLVDS